MGAKGFSGGFWACPLARHATRVAAALTVGLGLGAPGPVWAQGVASAPVAELRAPDNTSPCLIVNLTSNRQQYYAVPRTNIGFAEMYALLLTIAVNGQGAFIVFSQTATACGLPEITVVAVGFR